MFDFLQSIFAFILTIGILVTVHEWGHFQMARWLNVKILCFSIGFGKPLWQKQWGKDNTTFQIAAIPLGGYVKMLDAREGDVAENELSREFNQQSLFARSLIVVAGPLVNLIFAILVYIVMYMTGIVGTKPVIGFVEPTSIVADAGLAVGDRIIKVNDTLTPHWQSVQQAVLQQRLDSDSLALTFINKAGKTQRVVLSMHSFSLNDLAKRSVFKQLGFDRKRPPALLGELLADGPADKAGLQQGDKIIQVDDTLINNWYDWVLIIQENPLKALNVKFIRNERVETRVVTPDNKENKGLVGVRFGGEWPPEDYSHIERYGLQSAVSHALQKTWDVTWLSLRMMGKMLTLDISLEHISGPITIADFAGQSLSMGWQSFFTFIGLISISLGIMNLLPIPMLDGGHLLLYLVEAVKGSPLSPMAESIFLRFGVSVLILLMGLAFYNDFNRLLG